MTVPFTYGEVCAGVGGLSRGLELGGMTARFHAEIASFPRRVLKHHWPDVPLLSDLVAISGGRKMRAWMRRLFGDLLLLAGGTPCQDLSVAGKRAGLAGLRSSLFFRFVRLWKVLGCPYILWENVAGALSSNGGGDFALVLSAIVGGSVPIPTNGWARAGVVAGPTGVAAWRCVDAQYFGVPQRRLRVFVLGARAGGVDPAEVLLEPQGVRGNPPTRREAREAVAASAGVSAPQAIDFRNGDVGDLAGTLQAKGQDGGYSLNCQPGVLSFHANQDPSSDVERSLALGTTTAGMGVLSFSAKDAGNDAAYELAPTLRAGTHDASHENGGIMPAVVAFDTTQITHPENRCNPQPGAPCHPLAAGQHAPLIVSLSPEGSAAEELFGTLQAHHSSHNQGVICMTGEITHSLTSEGADASETGTGRGTPIVVFNEVGHEKWSEEEIAGSLNAHEAKEAHTIVASTLRTVSHPTSQAGPGEVMTSAGVPRRLVPIECERLMGWPDGWTDVPDANGKPAADSPRYRACGNGVVSQCGQWIGARLVIMHNAMIEARERVA